MPERKPLSGPAVTGSPVERQYQYQCLSSYQPVQWNLNLCLLSPNQQRPKLSKCLPSDSSPVPYQCHFTMDDKTRALVERMKERNRRRRKMKKERRKTHPMDTPLLNPASEPRSRSIAITTDAPAIRDATTQTEPTIVPAPRTIPPMLDADLQLDYEPPTEERTIVFVHRNQPPKQPNPIDRGIQRAKDTLKRRKPTSVPSSSTEPRRKKRPQTPPVSIKDLPRIPRK